MRAQRPLDEVEKLEMVLVAVESVEMVKVAHDDLAGMRVQERRHLREDVFERIARHAVHGVVPAVRLANDPEVQVPRAERQLVVDCRRLRLAPSRDVRGQRRGDDAAGGGVDGAEPRGKVAHARAREVVRAAVVRAG